VDAAVGGGVSLVFSHYYALGDSMSIDLYPALDLGATEVAVALERNVGAGAIAPVGAASLLHANAAGHWAEFEGRDLTTTHPGIALTNVATDGATIGDVFGDQLPELPDGDEEALVTLTVGGNDLLFAYGSHRGRSILERIVRDTVQAYDHLVDAVRRTLPNATILLTTVYDPSDTTGRIPDVYDGAPLPLQHLDTLNAHIRALAARIPNAKLADVHAHFLGHGVTVPEDERWYWRRSLIEPNAVGASEIRRVWLEALGE
jgi:hypothetical protein